MHDIEDLRQRQALPLRAKVLMSQSRISEWFNHWNGAVYVSFSGGKDSTVLAHLVHDLFPEVPLVFSNTGLEYPEIQAFAHKMGAEFIRPKMQFSEVISTYGYPIISKEVSKAIQCSRLIGEKYKNKRQRSQFLGNMAVGSGFSKKKWGLLAWETPFLISDRCCYHIKKRPMEEYQRRTKQLPFTGILAEESMLRLQTWLKHGCNSYDENKKTSTPMSFWREQDVLQYIKEQGLEIASVYGEIVTVGPDGMQYDSPLVSCGKLQCTGCQRTGCIFCGFGCHLEKGETRFQRLARTHPKQYEYCMMGGQWVDNPRYDPTAPEYDGDWKNWNPKQIWVPSKKGLGLKKVFDDCNQIYGKDFIRYE